MEYTNKVEFITNQEFSRTDLGSFLLSIIYAKNGDTLEVRRTSNKFFVVQYNQYTLYEYKLVGMFNDLGPALELAVNKAGYTVWGRSLS